MSDLKLVKPHQNLKDEYLSFYQEWKESGEEMVPWVISRDPSSFEAMLEFLEDHEKGDGLPEGWVSDSTFWLIDDKSRVLGAVNIRHELSEFLFNAGGHIGYGIRPSERGKGYATVLLRLSLVEAKKLGIEDVLVVCDAWNIASERTILKNGGRADVDYIEEDGIVIRRYWIKNS
ncbi:GNAT family N-acetyltransferase [Paenibacillus sp. DXFW5]|uniref:GNAT family N-acetyltransferase n=1 Tax=Paenibacillus rhizolycopersici TaxID=2780073 RepID=A0ABS2H3F7_9BACL|nr:GNAT family N-acetyltransferase [Paenibacillus rhizolycopersici]MBM6996007.1 GNAT family N-acetyltransferase [Paenibacillus rhizolycopersici]